MTIRISPAVLPPAPEGDEIARQVFAIISNGHMPTGEMMKDIVDFRQPNGLGRTFSAMVILAIQAVRTTSAQVQPINEPRVREVEKIVEREVIKEVTVPVVVRTKVDVLTDKRVAEVTDQILGEIGAAAMTAKAEKRAFGVRDLRPIIERGLR